MTKDEAIEIGHLLKGLAGLDAEAKGIAKVKDDVIGFEDDLFVPRAVFCVMVEAGRKEIWKRLLDLGVEI